MSAQLDRELKKGSAELLILSLLEDQPRHGYEIGQLIELRSRQTLRFNVASLYPLLYRLEKRDWIRGRWVEKAGQRRRRPHKGGTLSSHVLRQCSVANEAGDLQQKAPGGGVSAAV